MKGKLRTISKRTTLTIAIAWVLFFCYYSSMLMGLLAHELTHQHYSTNPVAIEINYDGTGTMEADLFAEHEHEWVYLNGYVIQGMLIFISIISMGIIFFYKEER